MKSIRSEIEKRVGEHVRNCVWNIVWIRVEDHVGTRVWTRVWVNIASPVLDRAAEVLHGKR